MSCDKNNIASLSWNIYYSICHFIGKVVHFCSTGCVIPHKIFPNLKRVSHSIENLLFQSDTNVTDRVPICYVKNISSSEHHKWQYARCVTCWVYTEKLQILQSKQSGEVFLY